MCTSTEFEEIKKGLLEAIEHAEGRSPNWGNATGISKVVADVVEEMTASEESVSG